MQPPHSSTVNTSTPSPVHSLLIPTPIPGTDLLVDWQPMEYRPWAPPSCSDFGAAAREMSAELISRLAREGNVLIGAAGVMTRQGKVFIEARENTQMTLNQTMGALIALESQERGIGYSDSIGDVYTADALQAQEPI
ncbi:MAG: hypothetical protein Q9191_007041, partial [Dirinaria sp. TL-2023a]